MKKVMLQAHRGVASEYPENTMAAYRAAVEQGYDIIEFDPDYTSDGGLVVFHDTNLARTARRADSSTIDNTVSVRNITLKEAMELDCGLWMGEKFRGEKMPMFEEVIEFSEKVGIPLKVDNKIWGFPEDVRKSLFAVLHKHKANAAVTCYNIAQAEFIVNEFPGTEIHYDGEVNEENLKALSRLVPKEKLTVWVAFPNKQTEWVKVRRADKELCAMVKKYAKLGVWILSDYADFEVAVNDFDADVIETTGHIKPQK